MTHRPSLALALLFASPLIGCGSGDQDAAPGKVAPVKSDVPAPAPRKVEIRAEGPYTITSDLDEGPKMRRVDVKLKKKVTPEVLREIALEVKAKGERPHERTIIFYYLPVEFPEIAGQAWATTHFLPALEVKILALSQQEEDALRSIPLDHKGKRIGAWLQDNQYKTLDLIYDDGAIKLAEFHSPTERSDSVMNELPTESGRSFSKVKGTNIYHVDDAGNLRISNAQGQVFSASKPIK
jgi:hypothetical protein